MVPHSPTPVSPGVKHANVRRTSFHPDGSFGVCLGKADASAAHMPQPGPPFPTSTVPGGQGDGTGVPRATGACRRGAPPTHRLHGPRRGRGGEEARGSAPAGCQPRIRPGRLPPRPPAPLPAREGAPGRAPATDRRSRRGGSRRVRPIPPPHPRPRLA